MQVQIFQPSWLSSWRRLCCTTPTSVRFVRKLVRKCIKHPYIDTHNTYTYSNIYIYVYDMKYYPFSCFVSVTAHEARTGTCRICWSSQLSKLTSQALRARTMVKGPVKVQKLMNIDMTDMTDTICLRLIVWDPSEKYRVLRMFDHIWDCLNIFNSPCLVSCALARVYLKKCILQLFPVIHSALININA